MITNQQIDYQQAGINLNPYQRSRKYFPFYNETSSRTKFKKYMECKKQKRTVSHS